MADASPRGQASPDLEPEFESMRTAKEKVAEEAEPQPEEEEPIPEEEETEPAPDEAGPVESWDDLEDFVFKNFDHRAAVAFPDLRIPTDPSTYVATESFTGGGWQRTIAHQAISAAIDTVQNKGYSVLATLKIRRVSAARSNSFNSATFDWTVHVLYIDQKPGIVSAVDEGPWAYVSAAAEEITARYFASYVNASQRTLYLYEQVEEKMHNLVNTIWGWYDTVNKGGSFSWKGEHITDLGILKTIRYDLIVAIGLCLPTTLGGVGMIERDALERASSTRDKLPIYIQIGGRPTPSTIKRVTLELEWTEAGRKTSVYVGTSFNAAVFLTNPLLYSSDVGGPNRDYLETNCIWVTLLLNDIAMQARMSNVFSSLDGKSVPQKSMTLMEAIQMAKSATWLNVGRLASVRLAIEGQVYKAGINNLIATDIGPDETQTYGASRVQTIRLFAEESMSTQPLVPSIQTILNEPQTGPDLIIMREDWHGGALRIPVLLDPQALACVPVLHTILRKTGGLIKNESRHGVPYRTRVNSRLNLSSMWGLQSPTFVGQHAVFLTGQLSILSLFFERVAHGLSSEELQMAEDALLSSVTISSRAGSAIDGLRGSRDNFSRFLAKEGSTGFALAYSWSVVQSSIILIWLVTYITTGVAPVLFPTVEEIPGEGIDTIHLIMKYTLTSWLKWDVINKSRIPRTVSAVRQLASSTGWLQHMLNNCRAMIWDSPEFEAD